MAGEKALLKEAWQFWQAGILVINEMATDEQAEEVLVVLFAAGEFQRSGEDKTE